MSAEASLIGDNSLAAVPSDVAGDEIDRVLAKRRERREALIASAGRTKVTDEDSTGRAGDLLAMMRALKDAVEAEAEGVRGPYNDAARLVHARRERFLATLQEAYSDVETKIDDYRTAERQRVQNQRDEQERAEQALLAKARAEQDLVEQAAAPPPPPPPPPAKPISLPSVRGDMGSLISDRATVEFEIVDVSLLPALILDHPKVVEAFKVAARDLYKLMKVIPGVKVVKGTKTSKRK